MKKQINQVKEFHEKFNILTNDEITIPSIRDRQLRNTLHREECREVEDELLFSENDDNVDQVAKELCDLLYVVYGTVLSYGLQDK